MITQTNDAVMNKAVFILKKMSADDKMREVARIRERALHDEASYMEDARAEGRSEERTAILEKLRALGVNEELLKKAGLQ